jgi:hypothetical protein
MSLSASIETSYSRQASYIVEVDGLSLGVVKGGSITFNLDFPVPSASLTLSSIPSWVKRGNSVVVYWVYDLYREMIFNGKVKKRHHGVSDSTLECVGQTNDLCRPFRVQPKVFNGVLAQTAVEEIFNDVKITKRLIDMEVWTLGSVKPAVIDLKSPADAVQHIIDVDGHRMYELPSGTIVIRQLLEVPGPAPFRTYKTTAGTNPRILDISDDEDEDQVKKKVYVSGATIETTDAEGNVTQVQIGGGDAPIYAQTASDDLVAGDPELYSMSYQNDLIDTEAKAAEVALRLLDKYHRVVERVTFVAPLDPQVQLAMTIGIEDAAVTGKIGRWFVNGYTHQWGMGQAETQFDLFGGDQSGTTGNVAPIADFVAWQERELIGTGEKLVVAFVSTSRDLDGEIVNYHWTDDYAGGGMDQQGASMTMATRVYDPLVDTEVNITLVVTDDGDPALTGTRTMTLQIQASQGEPATIPAIAAAIYNRYTVTPDGGFTWFDKTPTSGNVISVAAAPPVCPGALPVLLYGTDNGRIVRSLDGLATLPTLVMTAHLNSPVNDIWFDPNVAGRAYAGTEAGYLYRTDNWGATWITVLEACGYPIKAIAFQPPSRVYIYGGAATADPATWYSLAAWSDDGGLTFTYAPVGGALAAALTGATGTYYIAACASCVGNEMVIGLGGAGDMDPRVFYTTTFHDDGAGWTAATGLDGGLVVPRAIAPNLDGAGQFVMFFDTRDSWATTDGVAWAKHANVLAVGESVYCLGFLWPYKDIFIGASSAGLIKSVDACATVGHIRPVGGISTWPGGASGRKVVFVGTFAQGMLNVVLGIEDNSATGGKHHGTVTRESAGGWVKQSESGVDCTKTRMFHFPQTGDVVFRCRKLTASPYWQTLERSPDKGATWVEVATAPTVCTYIDRAPDGTLWALGSGGNTEPHCIYKSIDVGLTWAIVYTDTHQYVLGNYCYLNQIKVDPSNSQRIMAIGIAETWPGSNPIVQVSTDGGVVFTRKLPEFGHAVQPAPYSIALAAGENGRWVCAWVRSAGSLLEHHIGISDNEGTDWTVVDDRSIGAGAYLQFVRFGFHLYVLAGRGGTIAGLLLRSTNNMGTVEVIPLPVALTNAAAIAYDNANNRLVLGTQDANAQDPTLPVVWTMNDPSPSGTWVNVTSGLVAATGYDANLCSLEGLAVLG